MFSICNICCIKLSKLRKKSYRITKIKPFVEQYDWNDINFPSRSKDWKKFELNNNSIALNILYVPHNTKKIRHAYMSKYHLIRENQAILLMITDGKK